MVVVTANLLVLSRVSLNIVNISLDEILNPPWMHSEFS